MAGIFTFGHFHKWLDQQSIDLFQKVAVHVFMTTVHRIGTSYKTSYRVEFFLFVKGMPCIFRFQTVGLEWSPMDTTQEMDGSPERNVAHPATNRIHTRMIPVFRPEYVFRTFVFIIFKNIFSRHNGNWFFFVINKCHIVPDG